jgi:hypothetical protein
MGITVSWNATQAGTTTDKSKLRVINILSKAEVSIICWYWSDAQAGRKRCRLLGRLVLRALPHGVTVALPSSASLTR